MAKVGVVFPGQGSQQVGMGKDLYDAYPVAKQTFEEANTALGFDIATLCFEGPEDELKLTTNTQPAIVTTSIAALRVLQEHASFDIDFVAGHSLGEYSALVCADAIDFADAVRTVCKRGEFMQEAVPVGTGTMAAIIGMNQEQVESLCQQVNRDDNIVTLANINSPGQYVISGHTNAVDEVVDLAKQQGAKRAIPLAVSAPFHSALMHPAAEKLDQVLQTITFKDLQIPLINNAEAALITSGDEARKSLVRQMYKAVQWEQSVRLMIDQGVTTFIEVGPGKVLSGLLRRIDKKMKGINVGDTDTLAKAVQVLQE
ncbi:ACP S-malonyltransferase [candidate division KSB3 bacterium]|uniref:Malonyl CoA-acyl carrier protein transacylase n=1 Tax=candidate division KSB3 bacterium TaxID=2044937 RepID=A0A9D5JVW2_9BACT|nr:ACP S-malonyltransferase [candidate division KSB3 bacterium]MBD3325247.1 ACP S-malonyltransferase [candidate division KSB3 bacterium]